MFYTSSVIKLLRLDSNKITTGLSFQQVVFSTNPNHCLTLAQDTIPFHSQHGVQVLQGTGGTGVEESWLLFLAWGEPSYQQQFENAI